MSETCVLFETQDSSTVLIDIPQSIEEAQTLPGERPLARLLSCPPLEKPWNTPEPKYDTQHGYWVSPSVTITELMTLERVRVALDAIKSSHRGPWCRPRVTLESTSGTRDVTDNTNQEQSRKRKNGPMDPAAPTREDAILMPVQSHHLLGTLESRRDEFLSTAPNFDLILLDPPWPSRSARRKKDGYSTAYGVREAEALLSQVPISAHLKPDGLVAVWVTNKAAVTDLLMSHGGVFAQWGLEPVGDWIWLKVTASGEPVLDLDSQWRKPWERLLIARKKGSTVKLPVPSKVMLAVPDVHSRKPNMRSLFREVWPAGYQGLEVFARNLTAGWWGWGNEVLRFQQPEHWIPADEQTPECNGRASCH
ncbi:MT-A70-domain-containing protein [Xylariomycetidae sp. FL0641]|nr:MT-A70-domain-containing protein [Xylariomycetidae sp. FL0641]